MSRVASLSVVHMCKHHGFGQYKVHKDEKGGGGSMASKERLYV